MQTKPLQKHKNFRLNLNAYKFKNCTACRRTSTLMTLRFMVQVVHLMSAPCCRRLPDVWQLLQIGCRPIGSNLIPIRQFMWLTSPQSQHRLPTSGPLIGSSVVSPSATVRDLGVFIDQGLTMKTHVQQTASRCFTTLRQLRSIRRCIPTSVFNSLVSALVLSRLDYCNSDSLLIDLPVSLQSVQNAAARLIFNLIRCDHITDALISLHWLRVLKRIVFKVATVRATLTYRAMRGSAPPLLGVVIHMCRRHAAPTQALVRLHWTAWRSDLSWVNYRRSCLSWCWSKDVE